MRRKKQSFEDLSIRNIKFINVKRLAIRNSRELNRNHQMISFRSKKSSEQYQNSILTAQKHYKNGEIEEQMGEIDLF